MTGDDLAVPGDDGVWNLDVTASFVGCILKLTGFESDFDFDFGSGGVESVEYADADAVDSARSGETDGGLTLVTPENAEDEDDEAGACVRGWSRRRAGEESNVPGPGPGPGLLV